MKRLWLYLLSLTIVITMAACSGSEGVDPSTVWQPQPGDETVSLAALIILSPSKAVIKPDNSDVSEITATLLSASNVLLPNMQVAFSTDGGAINTASATTNSSGEAKITFKSGALANGGTATITATSGVATATITIQAADDRIPADMTISATPASIKSNDTEEAVITVSVLNSTGSTIAGQNVTFSATGGLLVGSSTLSTDSSGRASISLRSGTDKTNRTATVTATAGAISRDIPVQIFGSTLTLTPSASPSSLNIGQTELLTVTAKDASLNVVANTTISFTTAGTGGLNLSTTTVSTNASGQATVEVTGGSLGIGTLTVTGLGATVIKTYDIAGEAGTEFFRIVEPDTEHSSASLNSPVPILVSAPASSQVLFASTLGQWGNGLSTRTVPVVDGKAEAQLTSTLAGLANIQVSDGPALSDSVTISFSAAADTAASIHLQASATNMNTTVSSGAPQQVELRATVRSADNQVVGGAPVAFNIDVPTGGGEFISPPVAYTNDQGLAVTTFTSGNLIGEVPVTASLVDFPLLKSQISINIGGEAMSLTLGRATEITSLNSTTYSLPMSVLVSDGKGGPVANQAISLTVWPECYFASDLAHYRNEDWSNENGIMDAGEDLNGDGQLTPPSSVAGNIVPSPPITTDANGLGNFNLIYLKANYNTYVRVKATALVGGSETSSKMIFKLPVATNDVTNLPDPTFLPPLGLGGVCPNF